MRNPIKIIGTFIIVIICTTAIWYFLFFKPQLEKEGINTEAVIGNASKMFGEFERHKRIEVITIEHEGRTYDVFTLYGESITAVRVEN